jgi:hypothetical protein
MKSISSGVNKDFDQIFYRGESRELFGKRHINFFYLILILMLTFLAIGFANGSLKYLKKKMDDPFIKWVNIEIPYTIANQIPELIKSLSVDSLRNSYHFESCDGYNQASLYFLRKDGENLKQFTGRTITYQNPILTNVLSRKNLNTGHHWKDEFDIGLIVTRQLLNNLGYSNMNPGYILMSYPLLHDQHLEVPIPVSAVVSDLPGNNSFACNPYFYTKRMSRYFPFDISSEHYQRDELRYFVEGSNSEAILLSQNILGSLKNNLLFGYFSDTLILPNNNTVNKGYDIIFHFTEELPDSKLIHAFDMKIKEENYFKRSGMLRIYKYDLSGFENESESFDNLSIYFTSLNKIREFSSYLFENRKLKIDMSQIESKENYNFVSRLTIFISGFLVIFSVICIILFLSNVLKVHINKIKSNLGTFKAFGLNDSTIVRIYSILSLRFLLLGILASLSLTLIIGETGLFRILFQISGTTIERDVKYFDLLSDNKTYYALLAILITNLIILPWNIWRMLNKTPGDLIYKRD